MKGTRSAMMTAMLGAAAVTAQLVGGKATRDALFLTSLDFTALPAMLVATSVCSIVLVEAHARTSRWIAPASLVPGLFIVSGLLFLCEWLLRSSGPQAAAVVIYLHISSAGPLLASGFWLISSERFDPRTAKKRFGQIAGAGTLGGLLSALLAARVAAAFGVPAMLPLLASLQFLGAWLIRRLAAGSETAGKPTSTDGIWPAAPRSGLRVVAAAPHLRRLATLVLLGTTGAALVDYLFKAQAVQTFGRGDNLLHFFALYYAAGSLITLIVQTSSCRMVLERFGLGAATSTPSVAVLAGSLGSLLSPGFATLALARGGESVFRSSLFRAAYELMYAPMPAAEKRAAKSLIDVSCDRLGDAVGGLLVRAAVLLFPAAQSSAILSVSMACSIGALIAARGLGRGYIGTLENSLVNRGGGIGSPDAGDGSTRALMRSILDRKGVDRYVGRPETTSAGVALDPEIQDILSLRSRDRGRIVEVLSREDGLTAGLVSHTIPLLAWEPVADHALFALRKVAEERVGELVDALLDPNQDFAIRRRLARVFSVCVSERAAQGLMFGLEDPRFDVRCQSARSLVSLVEKNPRVHIDGERVFGAVLREVTVGRPVWESRRLLEGVVTESPLDDFVRDRAGESLTHVFTLLSLVLPREPLQIAFRSLHTDDEQLQGTALEYLDSVLPAPIRERLWPFLERRAVRRPGRPAQELIAELLRSNQSIRLNLAELRQAQP